MGTRFIPFTVADLRWLPNALTFSRLLLTFPIFYMAVRGEWRTGSILIAIALATDFLDGLAAKKLHAESTVGGYVDSVVDFLLAFAGVAGMISADMIPLWAVFAVAPVCLFIGYAKFIAPKGSRVQVMFPMVSLPLLFSTWTLMMWGYLTKAYGWSWAYVPVTVALLAVSALLKRHRLKAWYGWLLASRPFKRGR